jgi:YaiO family outer membrane protein
MSRIVGFFMLVSMTYGLWAQETSSGNPPVKDIPALNSQDSIPPAKKDIPDEDFPNTLEAGYRYENYLDNYSDRTFLYVQYGRRIKQVDLFGRVLRYTLGDNIGYQFETEAYWRFKKPGYMYFDAAYSNAVILPNYRLRAEIFQVANRFEYSFGLGVVKPFNFDLIPVITGTVGYYFGNSYIYARPTFTYIDNGFTKSIFIQARQYFSKTDFIALSALRGADTGTSRDISSIANSFGNDTYLVRFHGQFKTGRYKLGAGLDYGGIYIPERSEYARFIGIDVFINREF